MNTDADYATQVMHRIEALGRISDEAERLTRIFASPAMRRANDSVTGWMRQAGMAVREDAVGNLIGRYPAAGAREKTFILGSHLDTVRGAGRFDGPLGVLMALACVEQLQEAKQELPFAIEVIGFADEEGVRYQSAYLGSRALSGQLTLSDLARTDADGVSMAEAIRRFGGNPDALAGSRRESQELLGYAEVHIEQGPRLELAGQPLGVVSGIVGQSRVEVIFTGRSAHAGTTPIELRQDALAAAAEFVLAVETLALREPALLATVGQLDVQPGASNVIPGKVRLTVDVRHPSDTIREAALEALAGDGRHIAKQRRIGMQWQVVQSTASTACASGLTALLKRAAAAHVANVLELPSGAGHDAAILAAITPVAMLFVRCRGGVSHHPDESVEVNDISVGLAVLRDFLRLLEREFSHHESLLRTQSTRVG